MSRKKLKLLTPLCAFLLVFGLSMVVGHNAEAVDYSVINNGSSAAKLEGTRRHLEDPIEPIVPDWLAEADEYTLPAWYDATRVCAHTRLVLYWRHRRPAAFEHGASKLAEIGFKSLSRHIKGGSEGAWWPSRVGAVHEAAKEVNLAKQIIDEAHAAGCRIIVYYRHIEDEYVAQQHPEWAARNAGGEIVLQRGPRVCFNTPYAGYVETRLLELVEMGADGFYFDDSHMLKPFCWCDNCRQTFQATTGMEYPAEADPFDPAYQKAIEWKNVILERVFRRWRRAIHAANPECVMLIGSNRSWMHDRHTTHRLYRIADVMKTEFSLPARVLAPKNWPFHDDPDMRRPEVDTFLALGYAIARDAADGRPPHVWTHGLPNAAHAKFATAGVVAHGGVANLHNYEEAMPDHEKFAEAVALGNRVAPAVAGARPLRWAAVHWSEYARDHDMPDLKTVWRNVLYPTWGMFATLLRAHLPVGVITDSQLEQGRLDDVAVLLLPAPDRLTDPMRRAVAAFEQRGGRVIRQRDAWQWHAMPSGFPRAAAALIELLEPEAAVALVRLLGGPETMHAVAYLGADRRRLTVALVNDFSWVFTGRPQSARYAAAVKAPAPVPSPSENVSLALRLPGKIAAARDMVTGTALEPRGAAGAVRFDLPAFDCLAVIAIELAEPLP